MAHGIIHGAGVGSALSTEAILALPICWDENSLRGLPAIRDSGFLRSLLNQIQTTTLFRDLNIRLEQQHPSKGSTCPPSAKGTH